MRVFSLFSGIGGFEIPMVEAGWEIVGHSEIDKYANIIYDKHFPGVKNYGNIRDIKADDLPDFDMLCGGFPCQSFSIAGKRGGIYNDKQARGTLFYEIMRIAKIKRPRIIFLENVKGLLSSGYGYDFAEIIGALQDTMVQLWGDEWTIEWEVLNTKNFGLPQNRERVFIIARYTGEGSGQKVFPIGKDSKIFDKQKRQTVASTFQSTYKKGGVGAGHTLIADYRMDEGLRIRQDGNSPALNADCHRDHNTNKHLSKCPPLIMALRKRGNGAQKIEIRKDGLTNTLTSVQKDNYVIVDSIRRLTEKEGERLQGFRDDWTSAVSMSRRYECLGNAVSVNVIRAIVERINDRSN